MFGDPWPTAASSLLWRLFCAVVGRESLGGLEPYVRLVDVASQWSRPPKPPRRGPVYRLGSLLVRQLLRGRCFQHTQLGKPVVEVRRFIQNSVDRSPLFRVEGSAGHLRTFCYPP